LRVARISDARGLRLLERKTATVCTLLKASVYSIVLQQQIINEGEDARQHRQQQDDYMDGPSVLSTMMTGGGGGGEGDTITH